MVVGQPGININMVRTSRQYSDLDLDFLMHPRTRDVVKKVDEAAVKQSVLNLVRTMQGERLFHPEIGSQIYGLLFENFSPITQQVAAKMIEATIIKFEPRVDLTRILVSPAPDNNRIDVEIEFRIKNTTNPILIRTFLERAR